MTYGSEITGEYTIEILFDTETKAETKVFLRLLPFLLLFLTNISLAPNNVNFSLSFIKLLIFMCIFDQCISAFVYCQVIAIFGKNIEYYKSHYTASLRHESVQTIFFFFFFTP